MLTEMHPASIVQKNAALSGAEGGRSIIKGRDTFYIAKGASVVNPLASANITAGMTGGLPVTTMQGVTPIYGAASTGSDIADVTAMTKSNPYATTGLNT